MCRLAFLCSVGKIGRTRCILVSQHRMEKGILIATGAGAFFDFIFPQNFPPTWGKAFEIDQNGSSADHQIVIGRHLSCQEASRRGFILGILMMAAAFVFTLTYRRTIPAKYCFGMASVLLLQNISHNMLLLQRSSTKQSTVNELQMMVAMVWSVILMIVAYLGCARAVPEVAPETSSTTMLQDVLKQQQLQQQRMADVYVSDRRDMLQYLGILKTQQQLGESSGESGLPRFQDEVVDKGKEAEADSKVVALVRAEQRSPKRLVQIA